MPVQTREFERLGNPVAESRPTVNAPKTTPLAMKPPNISWHSGQVSPKFRQNLFCQKPATIWLTGLSGSGKSTLAYELEKQLMNEARPCFVLDGDNIRHCLNRDLGFSVHDQKENIRRAAEVARLMNEAGLIVITAFISPYREDRDMARAIIGESRYVEVHLSTSVDICETRDPKGLYVKARAGKILGFAGVSSPYEIPLLPAMTLDTGLLPLEQTAEKLFNLMAERFFG